MISYNIGKDIENIDDLIQIRIGDKIYGNHTKTSGGILCDGTPIIWEIETLDVLEDGSNIKKWFLKNK